LCKFVIIIGAGEGNLIPRYASKVNASGRSCLPILESCLPEIY
jgi:hypothetical protein